jgi:cobalt-zinc-cadmium efflux system outer membrane protein
MSLFTKHCFMAIGVTLSLLPMTHADEASLSFDQAWEKIQHLNPTLSAARSSVEASRSAATQADTQLNPELSVEAENFGGSGPNSGWDATETTLLINQPVETGGKRRARIAEARAGTDLSRVEQKTCQLELWHTLMERYVEALQAGEQEAIAGDNLRLTGERYRLISQRVQAGKAPPLEASRAEVESTLAQVELNKARRQTQLTHRRLALLWGHAKPDFNSIKGRLDSVQKGSLPDSGTQSPSTAPALMRAQTELAARNAALTRERAMAYPNVVVSAGLRRFENNEEFAWVGGIALPIPLFNRNRAGIQKAGHEVLRAEQLQQTALLQQQADHANLLVAAENAWQEIAALRDKALPAARDATEKAKIGYEQGKFSYLEWVDAERSFVSLRARWINTLSEYHKVLAAIGRLTGETTGLTLFNQP